MTDELPPPPRVVSTREVYRNRWMRLREDELRHEDGREGLYAVVEKSPAAIVVPLDGAEVVLVEQYRHPPKARFWEFPQGAWDGADAPDAESLARGELAEETGLRAGAIERIGRLYFAYGISDQHVDVWLATDLEQGEQDLEPEEEGLRVGRFEIAELDRMVAGGQIMDAATVAAWGLVRMRRPDQVGESS